MTLTNPELQITSELPLKRSYIVDEGVKYAINFNPELSSRLLSRLAVLQAQDDEKNIDSSS